MDAKFIPLAEVYQQQAGLAGIDLEIKQAPSDGYWTDTWMQEAFVITFCNTSDSF